LLVDYELTISIDEAVIGTKKILVRKGKRLEVTIPFGVRTGTVVRLRGARKITDGYDGDILIRIKVKTRSRRKVPAAVALAVAFVIICTVVLTNALSSSDETVEFTTATDESKNFQSPGMKIPDIVAGNITDSDYITVFHNIQPPFYYIRGEPVILKNNADATDPSWQQLREFIISDRTDSRMYLPFKYECGQFARDVHNNAEAAGIKAAFVAVFFVDEIEGHALNAFNTVDKGLVYIDCQGPEFSETEFYRYKEGMYDKRVYIMEGKTLRVVSLRPLLSLEYIIFYRPEGIVDFVEIYW